MGAVRTWTSTSWASTGALGSPRSARPRSRQGGAGNLDPAALFAPPEELKRHVDAVLRQAGEAPGHIFNLGHGIWQETDPDAVARLVDYVHEHR
jgi:uroporphyrinogen decarboxylase